LKNVIGDRISKAVNERPQKNKSKKKTLDY